MNELHKVAVICTRGTTQLLAFHHDQGGLQLPAGTVEPNEDVTIAAIRELQEETGLDVKSLHHLFSLEERLDPDEMVVVEDVPLLAEPHSNAPAILPSVARSWVRVKGSQNDFCRVAVEEWNLDLSTPVCVSSTEGFVRVSALQPYQRRHLFHATAPFDVAESWEVVAEGKYAFRCQWVPLNAAGLIEAHQRWIDVALPKLFR